uniref:CCHC-type domain-containing protein n=1 Tax=Fagus sylvatica TaxID=28930 RepID=A0A2N9G6T6_FAGSY
MVSSSTRAVDVNMLNMDEEVSDLVQQANKLVCKEGRFTLNASANASDQVDKRTLVRKVVADKVLNKNKVMVITTKAWVPTEGMLLDFCFDCGRLSHQRRDCKWGKQLNYGKGYGRWMLAKSILVKSNKVIDLLFHDVIDAHLKEKHRLNQEGKPMEGEASRTASEQSDQSECVSLVISNAEADTLLRRVMMVSEASHPAVGDETLDGIPQHGLPAEFEDLVPFEPNSPTDFHNSQSDTVESIPSMFVPETTTNITPHLIIQLGPVWAIRKTIEISEDSNMAVDKGKGKRSFEETEEATGQVTKKLKLEPIGSGKKGLATKSKGKGKIGETKRVRDLKKLARDKEGKKKLAKYAIETTTLPQINEEAKEAGLILPPKELYVNRVAAVVERMGFCKHCLVPSMGIAGGLCLAWKDGVDIEVTLANQFVINAMVFFDPPNQPWMMTFVHAPHNRSGDFNCILSQSEKKGGKRVGDLTRSELKPFLDSGELIDLGFKGNSFTWTNKRMVISQEDNSYLCNIPSNEEIKETLFSMNSNKCPGPDGLPFLFFKHYWSIVKSKVIAAVQNFFQSGRPLKQLNHTFIALIPKIDGASSVNQFRPIALCNVVYKIISKILASRLKTMLPKFISPWQRAFVPGRLIQDNSIIAFEVINAMKKSKRKLGYIALKMDMEKAYDRMECKSEAEGLFKGFPLTRQCPRVSHLLFVDDLIIFSRATMEDVSTVQSCIQKYQDWSGQKVNIKKSTVMFNQKVPRGLQRRLCQATGLKSSPFQSKYLGLPLSHDKSRSNTLEYVVEKVQQKVLGWKRSLLSQASRSCLIKSVASATPIYTMSSLSFPKKTCARIDVALRDFWWGKKEDKGVIYLKAWDTICVPKSAGGLGIRRFSDMNAALLAKLGWSVATKEDKAWVKYVSAKYLKGKSFWDVKKSSGSSWIWQSILNSRSALAKGFCWRISKAIGEGVAGLAVVCRDHMAKLLFIWTDLIKLDDPLMAEANAALLTARKATEVGFQSDDCGR